MSTVYKLLDFKWRDIDSILYLADSYNNTSGFDDSSQVVGGVSGIIRYNVLDTTFSTPSRHYYWLIYFRQLPTQKNPPRSLGFRTDRWSVITARTGNHFQITHNGISYWVYKSADVSYIPSIDKWQITSDNVDSNPVFVNEGTSKKNTVHDLGDKTGSTDQQIYLEGLTYLLNEPAQGQGTVTLTIKKPGQTLNFASRLLGKTVSQYISEDATIDIQNASSDWEILFEYQFGSSSGYALINSLLEAHDFGKSGSPTWNIEGDLIKCVEQTLSALKDIDGRTGNSGSFPSSFSSYNLDDVISSSFGSAYERITVVKKSSVNLPFEVGFHWQVGSSGQAALLKSDGTFVTWSEIYYQGTGGNYISIGQSNNWSNISFSGSIKVYEFFPSNGESDNGSWQTYDGSVAQSHSMTGCFIVFAIPS